MGDVEDYFSCPNCGRIISRSDIYCKECGVKIDKILEETSNNEAPEVTKLAQKAYERRFSLLQRFLYLITSPSKAMKDIASKPSYDGISVVVVLNIVVLSITAAIISEKIQISGPQSGTINAIFSSMIAFIPILGFVMVLVRWAVKSLIIKQACDSGSSWDFKTAASITGYAYIPDILLAIPCLIVSWFLIPTFYIDTSNLEVARQSLSNYQAQVSWLTLLPTLPLSLIGLAWKSYLGGLGTHFGTKEKCTTRQGVLIFSGLSLIGLLISSVL